MDRRRFENSDLKHNSIEVNVKTRDEEHQNNRLRIE